MSAKIKVVRTYTHLSSFFWDSKLSKDRKEELLKWVASLNEDDASKLEDLLGDTYDYCEDNLK